MVRVPASRGNSTRLELRSVDPTANPYLTFAAILTAGLDGIERKLEPTHAVDRNIYLMDESERRRAGITDLPDTLLEAVSKLQEDEVIQSAIGKHMARTFVDAKRLEYQSYRREVSQWEIDNYLEQY
jgi:glutamine synthetase